MGFFDDIFDAIGDFFSDIISWIIPIPEIPETPEQEQGVLVNKQSNNAYIPVVYGERLVGGVRAFIEVEGSSNNYLYICLVLCEGEINGITEIRIDDTAVTFDGSFAHGTTVTSNDTRFGTNVKVQPFFGTDDQVQSSLLNEDTTWNSSTNRKLSGLCYLAVRLEWDQDKFSNIPKIQAIVQGRKVPTINSNLTINPNEYSTNPAFCLLEYLTNTRYGKGISFGDLDIESFYNASQVAVTQVVPHSGSGTINLFDLNMVLDTSQKILENVKLMLRGMRGLLPYSEGIYKLIIETDGDSVLSLSKDNIIGGVKVSSERKNEKYNRININYISPDHNYDVNTVVYPETDAEHQTLKTADGGFLQELNLDLKMITNPYQALQFGKIVLNRSRNQLSVECTANYQAMDLSVGDIVELSDEVLGMVNKPFRVAGLSINLDYTVKLSLTEHQSAWYDFDELTEIPIIPDTNLANPYSVSPPASVTLSEELVAYNDGTIIVALDVDIGASPDSFVSQYQVEYKKTTDSDYIVHATGSRIKQRILNVETGVSYDVRVKAINSLGISSTYTSPLSAITIVGSNVNPSDVEDFSCNIIGKEAHLTWEQIPDLTLAYYQVRFSSLTSGATWENSVSLVEKVSRPATSITVPALVGTYLIKAVSKLNLFSTNATLITTNISEIGSFNAVETQTESPSFSGTKDNCEVIPSNNFLTVSNILWEEGDTIPSGSSVGDPRPATYTFNGDIDLGAVMTSRVTASISQFANNHDELFDDGRGFSLFEDATGLFDGTNPQGTNAHLEIALSDNGTDFTDFRNFVIGDYTARYYRFRLVMISRDGSSIPTVSALGVTVDMEDRIINGNNITSGAGTYSVSFAKPFYDDGVSPNYAIGITAQSMASGDYYVISNKAYNGFDITFKNGATNISRVFDFTAKGY